MLNLDEKQLKNINSRTNLKKFLDHVLANNVDKVTKMCNKGLDPNFHCPETGGMVWCGIFGFGMVWYAMVCYGMLWFGMVWYGKVR